MPDTAAIHNYIKRNARRVELAWYECAFENKGSGRVIEALREYQNPDGGFGHGLEADYKNPASTPIATNDAVIRLFRVNALDRNAPVVKDIVRYLKSGDGFDAEKKRWLFAVESNKNYPHAIWWEKDGDGISGFNPTVSLAAFLVCYGDDGGCYRDIVKEGFASLFGEKESGSDEIKCFLMAYTMLRENGINDLIDFEAVRARLIEIIQKTICPDITKYGIEYAATPSDFIAGCYPGFRTPRLDEMAMKEIENYPNILLPDGGFDIFWKWYTDYPEDFEQARSAWRPRICLEKLLFMKAMEDYEEQNR